MQEPRFPRSSLGESLKRHGQHDYFALPHASEEEQESAFVPFLRIGLSRGEKCLIYGGKDFEEKTRLWLQKAGQVVEMHQGRGPVEWAKESLFKKKFDPENLLQTFQQAQEKALHEGFATLRLVVDMGEIQKSNVSLAQFVEFEILKKRFFTERRALGLFLYPRENISPDFMLNVIYTHPYLIFQEKVCRNFFFIPQADVFETPPPNLEIYRILKNILDREITDEKLRESENRYRRLLSAVTSYTYTVQVENNQAVSTQHGPGCIAVTGYTSEEYLRDGNLWFSMIDEADKEKVVHHLNQILKGREVPPLEHRIRRRDGTVRWIRNTMVPCRNDRGELVRYDGVVEDIEERKQFEEALRKSEERYRLLAEFSADWVYWQAEDGHFVYVSPACERITGYRPRDFYEYPELLNRIIHPEDRMIWESHQTSEACTEDMAVPLEIRVIRKDGKSRWVYHVCRPIIDTQGVFQGLRAANHDITQRKRAQEALMKASRMEATATLAGGIAHDFNNLMMGVMGHAELLQMQLEENPEACEALTRIIQVAKKAGELSHQMLAFARRGKYVVKPVNLNVAIQKTLKMCDIPTSRVHLELKLEPEIPDVLGDPTQIGQIVMHLVTNSLEAIENQGSLTISTEKAHIKEEDAEQEELQPGHFIKMTVTDTGCGMNAETLSHVFEPFFTTKFQGRGLGLAAAYGIVQNHGGRIYGESKPGDGTTFTVILPVATDRPAHAPQTESELPHGTESILVIDESEMLLTLTGQMLEKLGYTVHLESQILPGVEAAQLRERPFNLALFNVSMPHLGAVEACGLLKQTNPEMAILISSDYEMDKESRAIFAGHATAFLQKPFHLEMLAQAVRKALNLAGGSA